MPRLPPVTSATRRTGGVEGDAGLMASSVAPGCRCTIPRVKGLGRSLSPGAGRAPPGARRRAGGGCALQDARLLPDDGEGARTQLRVTAAEGAGGMSAPMDCCRPLAIQAPSTGVAGSRTASRHGRRDRFGHGGRDRPGRAGGLLARRSAASRSVSSPSTPSGESEPLLRGVVCPARAFSRRFRNGVSKERSDATAEAKTGSSWTSWRGLRLGWLGLGAFAGRAAPTRSRSWRSRARARIGSPVLAAARERAPAALASLGGVGELRGDPELALWVRNASPNLTETADRPLAVEVESRPAGALAGQARRARGARRGGGQGGPLRGHGSGAAAGGRRCGGRSPSSTPPIASSARSGRGARAARAACTRRRARASATPQESALAVLEAELAQDEHDQLLDLVFSRFQAARAKLAALVWSLHRVVAAAGSATCRRSPSQCARGRFRSARRRRPP